MDYHYTTACNFYPSINTYYHQIRYWGLPSIDGGYLNKSRVYPIRIDFEKQTTGRYCILQQQMRKPTSKRLAAENFIRPMVVRTENRKYFVADEKNTAPDKDYSSKADVRVILLIMQDIAIQA